MVQVRINLAEGLVCWQVDIQKVWLLFSSVVLAFAFIFGNSIRQLYEAVILLFVIHPFDVGDWLMIGQAQHQASIAAVNSLSWVKFISQILKRVLLMIIPYCCQQHFTFMSNLLLTAAVGT